MLEHWVETGVFGIPQPISSSFQLDWIGLDWIGLYIKESAFLLITWMKSMLLYFASFKFGAAYSTTNICVEVSIPAVSTYLL